MFMLDQLSKDDLLKSFRITCAVAATYFAYRTISVEIDRRKFKNIPVPSPDYPIIGNVFSLTDMPGKRVYQWHEELNSPIIRLKMGAQNWIMISDPLLAHKVLGVNGKKTSGRPYSTFGYELYGKGGKGMGFIGQSKEWKASRKALLEILSQKNVGLYTDFIEMEANDLADRLVKESEEHNGVDPRKLIALNAMNVICHVSFGKKFESVDDPEYKNIIETVEKALYYAGASSDIPKFFPFLSFIHKYFGIEKKMADFIKYQRDPMIEKLISEARINDNVPNIIRTIEQDYNHFDADQKIVLLNDILDAGIDPIQHALRWSFALLCHYPEIQRDLASEIECFKKEHGRLPTFFDKKHLPLVQSTISECLRIHSPTTFGLPHLVTEDVTVDEYRIPAGSIVLSSYDHMQKSPNYINDGHVVNFRRFMSQDKSLYHITRGEFENRDLYTFGWGRRTCPGINLANAQIFSIFVNLFSKCTIEPIMDEGGNLIYPDRESGRNVGISTEILPYKVRFVRRSD